MADHHAHSYPGDLSSPLQTQTASNRPLSSPVTHRGSTYFPKRGAQVLEESNADPFYLEQTLTDTRNNYQQPGQRDVQCFEASNHQYFTLSSVNSRKNFPYPNPTQHHQPVRPRTSTDRSSRSAADHEQHQRIASGRTGERRKPVHCSQSSFGSGRSVPTPDLTPSSSFSSNYSSLIHPESRPTDQHHVSFEPQRITSDTGSHLYLTPCTPPPHQTQSALTSAVRPMTPNRSSRANMPRPSIDSFETITTMTSEDTSQPSVRYSRRGKPLPSLPNIRDGQGNKKGHGHHANGNQRTQIEPSMISPPSLINPVTMEPHASHFDQAFFIPANDCPSPVPSPGPAMSSPLTRELTADSPTQEHHPRRPMTSRSEAAYPEQSVWESDSDSESIGHKSLSKKPIDTLRKVRSRVHLRVARSAPRLNAAPPVPPIPTDGLTLEKFPSMPDQPGPPPPRPAPPPPISPAAMPKKNIPQSRPKRDIPSRPSVEKPHPHGRPDSRRGHGHNHQDRSTSSPAPPPPPKKPTISNATEYDMDRSTAAAAIQAQSRRRQRTESPGHGPGSSHASAPVPPPLPAAPASAPAFASSFPDREKLRTLCREERTENTIHNSLALGRQPLYRRFWESLRILSCHGDISPKPARKSF